MVLLVNHYRVVGADWAVGADGRPTGDVVALEHVKEDGTVCLIGSSTLGFTPEQIGQGVAAHKRSCEDKINYELDARDWAEATNDERMGR